MINLLTREEVIELARKIPPERWKYEINGDILDLPRNEKYSASVGPLGIEIGKSKMIGCPDNTLYQLMVYRFREADILGLVNAPRFAIFQSGSDLRGYYNKENRAMFREIDRKVKKFKREEFLATTRGRSFCDFLGINSELANKILEKVR